MNLKIACVNYEPASLYATKGYSCEQLEAYYNPTGVADEVHIFAFGDKDWTISPNIRVSGYQSFKELRARLTAYGPDVIRCYEAFQPNCDYALRLAVELNVPSYLSLHDMRVKYRSPISAFTVITGYTETVAARAAKVLGRPVEIQLNGIDSKLMRPLTPTQIDPRVIDAKYKVYTVATKDPVKNQKTAMKATQIVAKKVGSLAHIVAGHGTEEIEFDGVHLGVGNLPQDLVCEYLNWSDCFLQVQLTTDIGKAAAEALMVGRPAIQTGNSEGNVSVHIGQNNGIIIPFDKATDAEYVAEALWTCLNTEYDSKAIRERAIKLYDAGELRKLEAERYRRIAGDSIIRPEQTYGTPSQRRIILSRLTAGLFIYKMECKCSYNNLRRSARRMKRQLIGPKP